MTQTQKHVPHPLDYVQREVRNGVECRVLTEKQYQTLHQKQAELLAALKLALQSGEIDGAKCAMRVLNTIGRRAIAKAEGLSADEIVASREKAGSGWLEPSTYASDTHRGELSDDLGESPDF